ncbi:MAG: T9SS type A sorting domain-containing protein [Cytophagales bacterium]|nr:T9SS type A sorting domain-containing protein [Cytophagales bacterium]
MKFSLFQSGLGTDAGTNTLSFNGLTSFSELTGGNGSTNDPTLPVEWLQFLGKPENGLVRLSWSTASEINNDYFEVERAVDGLAFEVIGRLEGQGTSNERTDYLFRDTTPTRGINYHRIKQVDFDGQFDFSPIIDVNTNFFSFRQFEIFPNPTNDHLTVQFESFQQIPVSFSIVDLFGRTVLQSVLDPSEDLGSFTIDLPENMHPGIYLLMFDQNAKIDYRMFVNNDQKDRSMNFLFLLLKSSPDQ